MCWYLRGCSGACVFLSLPKEAADGQRRKECEVFPSFLLSLRGDLERKEAKETLHLPSQGAFVCGAEEEGDTPPKYAEEFYESRVCRRVTFLSPRLIALLRLCSWKVKPLAPYIPSYS